MKIIHLRAHLTSRGGADLRDPEIASRLWRFIRRAFPTCLVALLMPNHPHVIAVVDNIRAARITFARIIGAATRGHGRWTWERVHEPEILESQKRIRSCVHYVNMNPVYARLVPEPLAWKWSTHRDVIGATCDPWVTADMLQRFIREPRSGFEEWFHTTMTTDPKIDLEPTPLPMLAPRRTSPVVSLEEIRGAVLTATRGLHGDIRRRGRPRSLFFALAMDQGWTDASMLADFCEMSRSGAAIAGRSVTDKEMRALKMCLADGRLRVPVMSR